MEWSAIVAVENLTTLSHGLLAASDRLIHGAIGHSIHTIGW